jgi:hypothetical protein
MDSLLLLPPWVFTLIIVFFISITSLAGFKLARTFFPEFSIDGKDNATANIFIRLIGTLLTVMLAFVVISVWQDYEEQRKRTVLEACILGNLYRDSRGLNPDTENRIQQKIVTYTTDIVEKAWPSLKQNMESRETWMSFNLLYGDVIRYMPENEREKIVMIRMTEHMNSLATYRRMRILRNQNPVIPPVLWGTIICGSIITLIFSFLFTLNNRKLHHLMILSVSVMYGLIFSFMILMNYPYRSSVQISSKPLQHLLSDVFPTAEITEVVPVIEN